MKKEKHIIILVIERCKNCSVKKVRRKKIRERVTIQKIANKKNPDEKVTRMDGKNVDRNDKTYN